MKRSYFSLVVSIVIVLGGALFLKDSLAGYSTIQEVGIITGMEKLDLSRELIVKVLAKTEEGFSFPYYLKKVTLIRIIMTTMCYRFVLFLLFFSTLYMPPSLSLSADSHRKTGIERLYRFQLAFRNSLAKVVPLNSRWLAGAAGAYKVSNQSLCLSHIVSQK